MNPFEPSLVATDAAVRDRFVATLREVGTVVAACSATGVARSTLYRLRRRDRDFDAACAAAVGAATTDRLEDALLDRAINGVLRTKTYADGRVDVWRDYDNRLAFAMLKKRRPVPYGDGPAAVPPLRPVMSRAEFIAAIRMRPAVPGPDDAPTDDTAAGDTAAGHVLAG